MSNQPLGPPNCHGADAFLRRLNIRDAIRDHGGELLNFRDLLNSECQIYELRLGIKVKK